MFTPENKFITNITVCARQAVGRVLLGILQSIVFQESIIAWNKLFMFSKCIMYCNQKGVVPLNHLTSGSRVNYGILGISWKFGTM